VLDNLEHKIRDKSAIISVIGLGYVGLPLAVAFAEAGYHVLGVEIQKRRVDAVNRGESYIGDVTSERLAHVVSKKLLEATQNQDRLAEADSISLCVPTPLTKTKQPDLSYIVYETEEVAKRLRPEQLIVVESTTYPGTTREVCLPILEKNGLKVGKDFYLAFSPERIDPGTVKYSLKNVPKVVGGIESESTKMALLLYSQIVDKVYPVSSAEVAEMTKVFENVFRSVNIALVNETAQLCHVLGISMWEVIEAASTKPYGFMPFYPGPGVGGHCIPLDPYYLADKAREYDFHTRFIELAGEINERIPYYVVERIAEALNNHGKSIKDAKILVLGIAYKKDVGDPRESPSLKLVELLLKKGAKVDYNDPYIPETSYIKGHILKSIEVTQESLGKMDCVIIATNHTAYDYDQIVRWSKLVYDTRGATRKLNYKNIIRLGE
jgi:UDP-N-acetyl-D-glucosamine dehydrogenase